MWAARYGQLEIMKLLCACPSVDVSGRIYDKVSSCGDSVLTIALLQSNLSNFLGWKYCSINLLKGRNKRSIDSENVYSTI